MELTSTAVGELLGSTDVAEALLEPCACGAPRMLSLGLNSVVCSDSGCSYRVAARLYAILESYELTGDIEQYEVEEFCQERYYRSWVEFFEDDLEDVSDLKWRGVQKELLELIKDDIDVPQLIQISGVDCLSADQLYALCGDFQTIAELSEALEEDGVLFVAEGLGLTESHLIPVAIHIANSLIQHITEMEEFEEILGRNDE